MIKNLSSKYSRNFLIMLKNAADALITVSKRAIQKTVEATGDLIGNKIVDKIRLSKPSPQNNSETNEEEILRERCISPEKKTRNYSWSKINKIIIFNSAISRNKSPVGQYKKWTI